jgi:hypothetical protein
VSFLVLGVVVLIIIAIASIGALGEVGLAATYGRIWGWLAERRARR